MITADDLPEFDLLRRLHRAELDGYLTTRAEDRASAEMLKSFVERSQQDRRVNKVELFVPNPLAGEAARALHERSVSYAGDRYWDALRCFALVFRSRGIRSGARLRHDDRVQAEQLALEIDDQFMVAFSQKWRAEETIGWRSKASLYRSSADGFIAQFRLMDDSDSVREALSCLTSLVFQLRANGEFDATIELLNEGNALDPDGKRCPDGLANLHRAVGVACRMFGQMSRWRLLVAAIDEIGSAAGDRGDERGERACRRLFLQTRAVAEYVYYGNAVRALQFTLEAEELVVKHGAGPLSALVDLFNSEATIRRTMGPQRGDFERAMSVIEMARDVKRFYRTTDAVSVQRLKEAELLAEWGRPGDKERAMKHIRESLGEGETGRGGKPKTRLLLASLSNAGDVEALGHIDLVIARSSAIRSGLRRISEARALRAEWFFRAGEAQGGTGGALLKEVAAQEAQAPLVEFERFMDWRNVARMRFLIAQVLSATKIPEQNREALDHIVKAVAAGEAAIRSIVAPDDRDRFFSAFRPTVALALDLANRAADSEAAVRIHESVRSAGLVEMLLSGGSALPGNLRAEWENLLASRVEQNEISLPSADLTDVLETGDNEVEGDGRSSAGFRLAASRLPNEVVQTQQAFTRSFGTGAALLTDLQQPPLPELLGVFPTACLISYHWTASGGEGRLYRWWRLPNGNQGCDVVKPNPLQFLWLSAPESLSHAGWEAALRSDSNLLLPDEVAEVLRANLLTDLVVVPSGALWTFPWPGLLFDLVPLVVKARVRLIPSLWAAKAMQETLARVPGVGVQGVFDDRLSGARAERDALDRLQPVLGDLELLPSGVQLLIERLDPAARAVTFAVHGVRGDGGLDQALLLSDRPDEVLLAGHLFLADLPAIVVAGACWSASVNDQHFDPVGLPQASLSRGAHSYVGGVFGIHDRTTGEVLSLFYEQIAAGISAVEALRRAQFEWWSRSPNGKFVADWAGLVIISIEEIKPHLPNS
jgi:CHAT domain